MENLDRNEITVEAHTIISLLSNCSENTMTKILCGCNLMLKTMRIEFCGCPGCHKFIEDMYHFIREHEGRGISLHESDRIAYLSGLKNKPGIVVTLPALYRDIKEEIENGELKARRNT
jgi:hypothetical protein